MSFARVLRYMGAQRAEATAAIAPLLDRAFGPDRVGDWRLVPTGAIR